MEMPPVAMFGDAYIFCETFECFGLLYGYGQCLCAVGSRYEAAVAVCLFEVVFFCLDAYFIVCYQF